MKTILLLLILLVSTSFGSDITYRLRIEPEVIKSRDSDVTISITRIMGSEKEIKLGGTYLVKGRIKTKNPKVTTLYFGVTAPGNDGAEAAKGYSQSFYPEEYSSEFTLALTVANLGQMHLSAYERKPDGDTDWPKPIIRLNLKDIEL